MATVVTCPSCRTKLTLAGEFTPGQAVFCPACEKSFKIRAGGKKPAPRPQQIMPAPPSRPPAAETNPFAPPADWHGNSGGGGIVAPAPRRRSGGFLLGCFFVLFATAAGAAIGFGGVYLAFTQFDLNSVLADAGFKNLQTKKSDQKADKQDTDTGKDDKKEPPVPPDINKDDKKKVEPQPPDNIHPDKKTKTDKKNKADKKNKIPPPNPNADASFDEFKSIAKLAYSASGKYLATAGELQGTKGVQVWEAATNKLHTRLSGAPAEVSAMAISWNDKLIATHGPGSSNVYRHSLEDGKVKQTTTLTGGVAGGERHLTFAPSSRFCVFTGKNVMDVGYRSSELNLFKLTQEIRKFTSYSTAYSPLDGSIAVFGKKQGSSPIFLWDVSSERVNLYLSQFSRGGERPVFSRDGSTLAAVVKSGDKMVVDIRRRKLLAGEGARHQLQKPLDAMGLYQQMILSLNGDYMAGFLRSATDGGGKMDIWNVEAKQLIGTFDCPAFNDVVLHPDGQTLVFAVKTKPLLQFRDIATGAEKKQPGQAIYLEDGEAYDYDKTMVGRKWHKFAPPETKFFVLLPEEPPNKAKPYKGFDHAYTLEGKDKVTFSIHYTNPDAKLSTLTDKEKQDHVRQLVRPLPPVKGGLYSSNYFRGPGRGMRGSYYDKDTSTYYLREIYVYNSRVVLFEGKYRYPSLFGESAWKAFTTYINFPRP